MAIKRRPDTKSVQGAINSVQALLVKQVSPLPLTPEEEIAFQDVIAHREAATWDKHDLRIAAQLARNVVHIERCHERIANEGYTVVNERGTTIENPALRSMMSLTATQLQLNKTLGLSASQKGLSSHDQDKRNAADRLARSALEAAAEEDGLI